ncbi:MAG: hypothetical protein ACTSPB_01990 [Candidatus Thorarchaeota archaeon]
MRKFAALLVVLCLVLWTGVSFAADKKEVYVKSSVSDVIYVLQTGETYEVKDLLHEEANRRPYTLLGPVKLAFDFFGELLQRLTATTQPNLIFNWDEDGKIYSTIGGEFIIQEGDSIDWIGGVVEDDCFIGVRSREISLPGRFGEVLSKLQLEIVYVFGTGLRPGLMYEFR